jgi:hypothetical protein
MASRKASACAKHGDHDGRLLLIVDRILNGTLGFATRKTTQCRRRVYFGAL